MEIPDKISKGVIPKFDFKIGIKLVEDDPFAEEEEFEIISLPDWLIKAIMLEKDWAYQQGKEDKISEIRKVLSVKQ